jgi:hypothetical protein
VADVGETVELLVREGAAALKELAGRPGVVFEEAIEQIHHSVRTGLYRPASNPVAPARSMPAMSKPLFPYGW